jgi:hypothetical protein
MKLDRKNISNTSFDNSQGDAIIIIIIRRNGAKTRSPQNFVWGLNNKKRRKNNKSPNFVWGLNKKRSKRNMSPKLSLGAIIIRIHSKQVIKLPDRFVSMPNNQ